MLPLHLHGWNRGSSGVPSLRHMRQVGLSTEPDSLMAFEAAVSFRERSSNVTWFSESWSGSGNDAPLKNGS